MSHPMDREYLQQMARILHAKLPDAEDWMQHIK